MNFNAIFLLVGEVKWKIMERNFYIDFLSIKIMKKYFTIINT